LATGRNYRAFALLIAFPAALAAAGPIATGVSRWKLSSKN